MYICIYVYMYICIYVYMYISIYVYVYILDQHNHILKCRGTCDPLSPLPYVAQVTFLYLNIKKYK